MTPDGGTGDFGKSVSDATQELFACPRVFTLMHPVPSSDFVGNLTKLLHEALVGPAPDGPSAFLDKGGGLLQTLASVDAAAASHALVSGGTTIAAHALHLEYYVWVLWEFMHGRKPKVDWPGSWKQQTVSSEEWAAVQQRVREWSDRLQEFVRSRETWDDDSIGDCLAILAHTAYHLGAIRQLVTLARRRQALSTGAP